MIIVGDWIRRDKRGAPHLVESIVAGDVITKCGRRMKDEPNRDGGLILALYGRKCRVCLPHDGAVT